MPARWQTRRIMLKPSEKPKIEDSDYKLIRSINSGRKDLFYQLVERYQSKLYNFGLRMCDNPSDAEDMVQDAFLNAFRYLGSFRYETKFKNWLYRVATSACLKKKRKSRHAPEREISLEEFLPSDESDIVSKMPKWASQPLESVLNDELAVEIRNAILELPEKYRLVFVLRDIEAFSTMETAEILNLTSTNIKVRLHRARLFLRDKLKTYYKNE